jgi:hypothetical protein
MAEKLVIVNGALPTTMSLNRARQPFQHIECFCSRLAAICRLERLLAGPAGWRPKGGQSMAITVTYMSRGKTCARNARDRWASLRSTHPTPYRM